MSRGFETVPFMVFVNKSNCTAAIPPFRKTACFSLKQRYVEYSAFRNT